MSKLVPSGGNDMVMTPDYLAELVVRHFLPQIGKYDHVLDPCCGEGAFPRAFTSAGCNYYSFDIEGLSEFSPGPGVDFLSWTVKIPWIITNPPWSQMRKFLKRAYLVADNVVFLTTVNHVLALKARLRDMKEAGFGLKEVLFVHTPLEPWPQSGFQLGAIHLQRGWEGDRPIKLTWS